ncbi:TPA: hypothetical protein ACKP7D_003504 [Serratia marcescens]
MKVIKKTLTALTLGTLLTTGAAQATPVSPVVTTTGELVFANSGTANIKFNPANNLLAGKLKSGTILGSIEATATAGDVAVRWTPGVGSPIVNGFGFALNDLKGKTQDKVLQVMFNDAVENPAAYTCTKDEQWCVNNALNTGNVTYKVFNTSDTVVPVDTYTVSLDAVVWQR